MFYSASTSLPEVLQDNRLNICDMGTYYLLVEHAIGREFSMEKFESFVSIYDDAHQDRIRVSLGRLVGTGHIEIKGEQ